MKINTVMTIVVAVVVAAAAAAGGGHCSQCFVDAAAVGVVVVVNATGAAGVVQYSTPSFMYTWGKGGWTKAGLMDLRNLCIFQG